MARLAGLVDRLVWAPTDARIYALLRIAFAGVSLLNLVDLWPHRHPFFSASGLIDLETVRTAVGDRPYYSIFYVVTSEAGTTAVFLGAAVAMVALGLGLHTRVSALLVYGWYLSYNYRAFPVLHGWDRLLLITAFLLLLAPIGRAWSLDARRRGPSGPGIARAPVYGLHLIRLQVLALYLDTVWQKVDDRFWRSGEFMSYFMMSVYARVPVAGMADLEVLSALLTHATLAVELAVPWLLLFRRTRPWGFLCGYALHLAIAAGSTLVVFSLAMMLTYLAFLDDDDMAWLALRTRRLSGWLRGAGGHRRPALVEGDAHAE